MRGVEEGVQVLLGSATPEEVLHCPYDLEGAAHLIQVAPDAR
jgi:hypothetical protein